VHAGLPFLMSNAFMGSRPGHPFWSSVLTEMPKLADQEVFYSTGPSMITAMALRMTPEERPALLLPRVWSPLRDGGLPTRGDAKLKAMLDGVAALVAGDGRPYVSHKWLTTWVPFYRRPNAFWPLFQVPAKIQWAVRRRKYRALAAVRIADPLLQYHEQRFGPAEPKATVFVGVRLDDDKPLHADLARALRDLSYPPNLLRFGFHSGAASEAEQARVRESLAPFAEDRPPAVEFAPNATRAQANNWLIEAGAAAAEKVLLVGGLVRTIRADAIQTALGAGTPVVAANALLADGGADLSVFRYRHRPVFRILYKVGGVSGAVLPLPEHRAVLGEQRAFRIVPLDGVGDGFVLIDREVIAAGARFAEERYKLHLNGEAFGLMARDLGFEVAGLPGLVVVSGEPVTPARSPVFPADPSAPVPG
jgi:hypothetical protein